MVGSLPIVHPELTGDLLDLPGEPDPHRLWGLVQLAGDLGPAPALGPPLVVSTAF
jgi:hypothetical protein